MDDYKQYDATALARMVARGEVSASELLDAALDRLAAVNPHLNACVNLRLEVARAHIAKGLPAGPLTGVPFLLKDLGAEAREFPGHNGSEVLRDTVWPRDSTIFQRIRDAGLVTFGRTTAPEGGIGPTTEARIYGGPTRNPWDFSRSSGGSSGGAAAAVAAGIVPAAHGSDGGGSIRGPAASCGLFGLKPTRARLPEGPYVGEGWAGMTTEGFLTRSVRDTAVLLDACAGHEPGAPYCAPGLAQSFSAALQSRPKELRIAMVREAFTGAPVDSACADAVTQTAVLLESMGHHVEVATPDADHAAMMRAWTVIVACGTFSWVRRVAGDSYHSRLEDLEPVAAGACRYAESLSGGDYLDAVSTIHAFGRQMEAFMARYDVILTSSLAELPARLGRFTHAQPGFDDFVSYRNGPNGVFAYTPNLAAFNASGQPAASIPLHWTEDGLPIGIHLSAGFGKDDLLLSLCAVLEEAMPWGHRYPAPVPD